MSFLPGPAPTTLEPSVRIAVTAKSGRVAVLDLPDERAQYLIRLGIARPVETATNERREVAMLPRPQRR